VHIFGAASIEERAALMTNAIAVLAPTHYREPFGGVMVEAQLCGTPAITTDHGAFCETIEGRWRCGSHREFVEAARRAQTLSFGERAAIKARASRLFSLEPAAQRYHRYFQRLLDRFGDGWYQMPPLKLSEINKPLFDRIRREEMPQAKRIAEWMRAHYRKESIYDVGCGPGIYVEEMRRAGLNAEGCDNSPDLPDEWWLHKIDVTAMLPTRSADIVLSLEVGEHIPIAKCYYIDYLATLDAHTIYFSAAAPGQGGEGHINCQPKSYWLKLFGQHGYYYDPEATKEWLDFMAAGDHMGWLLQNGMVLRCVR